MERTGGAFYSEALLLALVRAGLTRDEAYLRVQPHALAAASGEGRFLDLVVRDEAITEVLGEHGVRSIVDPGHALRYVDTLFERVFGSSSK